MGQNYRSEELIEVEIEENKARRLKKETKNNGE